MKRWGKNEVHDQHREALGEVVREARASLLMKLRFIEVHGESHYLPALERLASEHGVDLAHVDDFDIDDVPVQLIPEPTNPYDPHAIMVVSPTNRDRLGYMAREKAAEYAEAIAKIAMEHDLWCAAQVGGARHDDGWRIGIQLLLPIPSKMAQDLTLIPQA
jgi:hypothetical protein